MTASATCTMPWLTRRRPVASEVILCGSCGWRVGPVWKDGGETCVCIEPTGHRLPHKCSCGAWFEGCGHPPEAVACDE